MSQMNAQIKEILKYKYWRQNIRLNTELGTPGSIKPQLWDFLNLPDSLTGKSFLDVGANDGMFSFEAEKRGASRVVASDLYKDSIDSMKNGWSMVGIRLLINHFNSKVELHQSGIYNLTELHESFDVVLVNDIINWLDDVELAVKNLAEVTSGRLYLSDGFINDNKTSRKVKQEGPSLRYMYTMPYICDLLRKHGFTIKKIKPLNYQKVFLQDFIQTPVLKLEPGISVYELPLSDSSHTKLDKAMEVKADGQLGDYFHVYKLGWFKKSDIHFRYNKASLYYRVANLTGMRSIYYAMLNYQYKKKENISAYQIVAEKAS